jgi:hypothetical protein
VVCSFNAEVDVQTPSFLSFPDFSRERQEEGAFCLVSGAMAAQLVKRSPVRICTRSAFNRKEGKYARNDSPYFIGSLTYWRAPDLAA